MTPSQMLDSSGKFWCVARVNLSDLGSSPYEVLEGGEGIVSALAGNRVDPFPNGIPVMDDDGIFVTE